MSKVRFSETKRRITAGANPFQIVVTEQAKPTNVTQEDEEQVGAVAPLHAR